MDVNIYHERRFFHRDEHPTAPVVRTKSKLFHSLTSVCAVVSAEFTSLALKYVRPGRIIYHSPIRLERTWFVCRLLPPLKLCRRAMCVNHLPPFIQRKQRFLCHFVKFHPCRPRVHRMLYSSSCALSLPISVCNLRVS